MSIKKTLKIIMLEKDLKNEYVANKLNITTQSFANKLSRRDVNMSYDNLVAFLNALDCDLVIRDRATGKIYDIGPVTPVGEIGEVDSGAVSPQNNSKKQKPTD